MSFLDILKTAFRNLWRNKVRTILTILAVFIGSFAISLTLGVNLGVSNFIETQVGGLGAKDVINVMPKQEEKTNSDGLSVYNDKEKGAVDGFGSPTLTDKDISKLKKIKGVKKVETPSTPNFDYIQGKNNQKYKISAQPVVPSMKVKMLEGRQVNQDAQTNEIVLSENYVRSLGYLKIKDIVGKEVQLQVSSVRGDKKLVQAKVTGVQQSNMLIANGSSWINSKFADEMIAFNQEGMPEASKNNYFALMVTATDENQVGEVKEAIIKAGYNASTFEESIKSVSSVVNAITGGLVMFGAISLLAAVFGIVNTLYMSVQERTKEIGLMKALGLSSRKVFTLFSWEAILIGLLGSLIGILLAMLTGQAINSLAAQSFLKDLPDFKLIRFEWLPSLIITLVIMLIAFLAGALPSRKAAKLDPISSLRSE